MELHARIKNVASVHDNLKTVQIQTNVICIYNNQHTDAYVNVYDISKTFPHSNSSVSSPMSYGSLYNRMDDTQKCV